MRPVLARLAVVALLSGTASCSGDGPDFIWFRAVNAVPDSPVLRVSFSDYVYRQDLGFGFSGDEGPESLLSGAGLSARMTLAYLPPGNARGEELTRLDVPIAKGSTTSIVLAGRFDAIEPILAVTPRRARPLGSLYFQFVHATPSLGPLDVYVTAPDTELTATAPFATVQPLAYSESLATPFGPTRIRITAAGSLEVLMDSGELGFAEREGKAGPGAEWLFAISPSVTAGPAPVFLAGSPGDASSTIFDADTPSTLRGFHAARDAGPADLVALTEPPSVLLNDLEFRQRSELVPGPAGPTSLEFRVAGQADSPLASIDTTLLRGREYGAFLVATGETNTAVVTESDTRSIATAAKLRFAHLAAGTGGVSVYLTGSADEERAPANALVLQRPLGSVTSHASLAPGDYFLTVTELPVDAGANDPESVITGPEPFALAGGDVLTLGVFAPDTDGEPEVVLQFDDALP